MRRRRSPEQIKQLLTEQRSGGESIAEFCRSRGINTGTFYAWRAKYATGKKLVSAPGGFTRLVTPSSLVAAAPPPLQEVTSCAATTVYLPGGARLELTNWPLADLIRLSRELCPGADA
ncbi:IS66 family insertion sequence element accessory protein TnpA [Neolewinella sp.]|uniref:IS66 family insertion sequence element accessory protein TnpA n=1 Tax=Neolewinella sp. TaxID=2993543 RepID=UPI003B52F9C6